MSRVNPAVSLSQLPAPFIFFLMQVTNSFTDWSLHRLQTPKQRGLLSITLPHTGKISWRGQSRNLQWDGKNKQLTQESYLRKPNLKVRLVMIPWIQKRNEIPKLTGCPCFAFLSPRNGKTFLPACEKLLSPKQTPTAIPSQNPAVAGSRQHTARQASPNSLFLNCVKLLDMKKYFPLQCYK